MQKQYFYNNFLSIIRGLPAKRRKISADAVKGEKYRWPDIFPSGLFFKEDCTAAKNEAALSFTARKFPEHEQKLLNFKDISRQ